MFAVDEREIDDHLLNGEPVGIMDPDCVQPGQAFAFYCSEHRDQGMKGTLTIG